MPGGRVHDRGARRHNSFQFGAANSPEQGETLWRLARLRTGATSLFDVVMTFDYPSRVAILFAPVAGPAPRPGPA